MLRKLIKLGYVSYLSLILALIIFSFNGCNDDSPQSGLSIVSFSPSQGNSETNVIISGSGFSPKITDNIVKVNNVSVTVISASTTSITILINEEVTTGAISIQVSGKTVTSKDVFTKLPAKWNQLNDVSSTGRQAAVGFAIGSKGYIGTGYNGSNYLNDFWEFDPSTGAWTQKANFSGEARYYATGFSLNGKGYIGTGYAFDYYFKDFWEYDPSQNKWTQKADFGGVGRDYATGFSIGAYGYIGAGFDGTSDRTDFWKYDPNFNAWSQVASYLGTGRRRLFSFVIGSKAYAGGGTTKNVDFHSDFWEYEPIANSWIQKSNTGIPFNSASSFSIGLNGFVGTSGLGSNISKEFWRYNSTTNLWNRKIDFAGAASYGAVGFSIANKGYFVSGYDYPNGIFTKHTWEYLP
jgi:hypothetical protein